MKKFAVIGNPINHSKSPIIHNKFAKQFNMKEFFYEKILATMDNFSVIIKDFFLRGGNGINVTSPFKKKAFLICNQTTDRAKKSGSVNTIKYIDSVLFGDNTDGIGLLQDLKRLKIINSNDNILIIGSGGAVYGIMHDLLFFGCKITVINKTFKNTVILHNFFKKNKNIKILDFNEINKKNNFNLVINATSGSILNEKLILPKKLYIDKNTKCYDISYHQNYRLTPFLIWCKKKQARILHNGIGMLVCQAAHSFLFWNNIFPNYKTVIECLKKNEK